MAMMRVDKPYSWLVRFGGFLDSLKNLPEEGVAEVVFPGRSPSFRLFVPLSPGAGRDVYLHHVREPFSSATYVATLRILGYDTTVYEIGANVGYYLVPGAMYARRVYAFEPQKSLHRYLVENIRLNGLYGVDLHSAAVWVDSGTVRMRSSDKHNLARVDDAGDVEVEAVTPYDLPVPRTERSVVRMDIEGGELYVLPSIVDRVSPDYIFVELHPNIVGTYAAVSLASYLVSEGYVPLTYLEPLPETIGLPFSATVWRLTGIGPQFDLLDFDGLLRGLYGAFSRGWVVHTHWYRDYEVLRKVLSYAPWRMVF